MDNKQLLVFPLLRLAMGWMFFWAFIDKLFGLGFATTADKSWLTGISPTYGFLKFASQGPFKDVFASLAGSAVVDWLFMLGLLGLGVALLLGIGMRLVAYAGSLLLFFMWLALLFPKNNPFLDEHIIYILVLWALYKTKAGDEWGFGKWWKKTILVKKYPLLQ